MTRVCCVFVASIICGSSCFATLSDHFVEVIHGIHGLTSNYGSFLTKQAMELFLYSVMLFVCVYGTQ